ncbi:MAG: rhomboid family intramembrane serine protease [Candidatus Nanohaloarchaeota archaeon QJJ-9]|nr:rhomboid family intramembrane serine protease [Candidatus Nanohaloarchaeota archaeon QJJ-9]
MPECSECGKSVSMPFRCKFCGETFCSDHRLPENHDCDSLEEYKEKKAGDEVTYNVDRVNTGVESSSGISERLKDKFSSLTSRNRQVSRGSIGRRAPSRHHLPRATYYLLGIIVVVYVLQLLFGITGKFSLAPFKVFKEPWRFVTNIFLHSTQTPFHLLFNGIVLYFFGAELERRVGTRKFLEIFFTSGIVAALGFTMFVRYSGIFNCANAACSAVGASGALYGVFATLAIIAPEITVLAFFIFPMRIRTALVFFAIIDILSLGTASPVASSAHLTGLVAGLAFGFYLKNRIGRSTAFS